MNEMDEGNLECNNVQDLLERIYPIKVKLIRKLYGFEDKNFYVEMESQGPERKEYIFKIINEENSRDPNLYKEISKALNHLKGVGFSVPTPLKNKHGRLYSVETLVDNFESRKHLILLLKFVPGKPMIELKEDEICKENFFRIVRHSAKNVAEVIKELTYNCVLDEDILRRENCSWKVENFTRAYVEPLLRYIANVHVRQICRKYLNGFENHLASKLPYFRNAIINNDVNSGNIILQQSGAYHQPRDERDEFFWQYKGLIDFNELTASKYIFEIVTFQIYMMIDALKYHYDVIQTALPNVLCQDLKKSCN